MARLARLTLPGHVHHVIHRGHNRSPIFVDRADRERMETLLAEHARTSEVAVHAFALLNDQMNLLATPAGPDGVSRWMQAVGRAYVRYFNDRHGRSGTLWEGRYRSTLVQEDRHLLDCMVLLDLLPVQAELAHDPAAFEWSSHAHYAGSHTRRWLSSPRVYWQLGNTPFEREAAYVARVQAGLSTSLQHRIEDGTRHGWALGDDAFLHSLGAQSPRRVQKQRAGRRAARAQGPGAA